MSFSILSSAPLSLRRGSEGAAGWVWQPEKVNPPQTGRSCGTQAFIQDLKVHLFPPKSTDYSNKRYHLSPKLCLIYISWVVSGGPLLPLLEQPYQLFSENFCRKLSDYNKKEVLPSFLCFARNNKYYKVRVEFSFP